MTVSIGQIGAGSPANGPSLVQGQEQVLPSLSVAGEYRIYMDSTTKQLMLSEDGGAYAPFTTGALALSLQGAYDGGQSILTTAALGDIAFSRGAGTAADQLLTLTDAQADGRTAPLLEVADANTGVGVGVSIARSVGAAGSVALLVEGTQGAIRAQAGVGPDVALWSGGLNTPSINSVIFQTGDAVFGGSAMVSTERLRVVTAGPGAAIRGEAAIGDPVLQGVDTAGPTITSVIFGSGQAVFGGTAPVGAEVLRVAGAIRGEGQIGSFSGADANPISALDTTGVRLGPGGAGALDLTMSRVAGLLFNFNQGARFGGDIERQDSAWTVRTTRTTDGAGYNLTVRSGDAVAAAGAASGGVASLQSGNSQAFAGGAPGAESNWIAGNAAAIAASGAQNGGDLIGQVGNGADGGVQGRVIWRNQANTATPDVLPRTDGEGNMGTAGTRWGLVRAVAITSGAYYEEETFDEESLDLKGKVAALKQELDAPTHPEGLRHLAKITMVTARTVLDLAKRSRKAA